MMTMIQISETNICVVMTMISNLHFKNFTNHVDSSIRLMPDKKKNQYSLAAARQKKKKNQHSLAAAEEKNNLDGFAVLLLHLVFFRFLNTRDLASWSQSKIRNCKTQLWLK